MKKAISTSFMNVCSWLFLLVLLTGAVNVSSGQSQCSLKCNDMIQVSLDEDCMVTLEPDDILEGAIPTACGALQVQVKRGGIWQPTSATAGNATLTSADLSPCGKVLEVRVRQVVGNQSCWGRIIVEDKLPPVVTVRDVWAICAAKGDNDPGDDQLDSGFDPDYAATVLNLPDARPTVSDNCSTPSRSFVDGPLVDVSCTAPAINGRFVSAYFVRKWTFRDGCGNETVSEQFIYFMRRNVYNVQFAAAAADVPCAQGKAYPGNPLLAPANSPFIVTPEGVTLLLYPNENYCEFNITYTDQVIPVCTGTFKIIRTWVIYDWCLPTGTFTSPVPYSNPRYHIQVIKVVDNAGPVVDCPANMTVSTDALKCCATVDLPDVIASDACSKVASVTAMVTGIDPVTGNQIGMFTVTGRVGDFPGNNWWTPDTMVYVNRTTCLPIGTHNVQYTISDDCGNQTICAFTLTIADYTAPIAACDKVTVGSIDGDDEDDCYLPSANGCDKAGIGWIKAETFDDGSYDNCNNPLIFKVRRMAPYSAFIESLNKNDGIPPCNDNNGRPTEYERATTPQGSLVDDGYGGGADSLKIYCGEVGTTQTVILRIYQTNADGSLSLGPDGEPVYNECMIQIEVQDKVRPTCVPPRSMTVTCENFDPSLWAYGVPTVDDNCCLDSTKRYLALKGITHTANYSLFDTACNVGTIDRTFTAFDCHGFTSRCTQRVIVTYKEDYYVKFPDDRIITKCDGTGQYGVPTFFGEDCELLATSFRDDTFTVVPDACYKIERHWKIINWCTYDPNCPLTYVPNPSPNVQVNNSANLPGPIVSNIDGCLQANALNPWRSACVRINPTDAQPTSYTQFWQRAQSCPLKGRSHFNGYEYTQIIKIIDTEKPTAPCVKPDTCDLTENDPAFWNVDYWWDATHASHDLCEMPIDLKITATDACSGPNVGIRYLLFLDLDNNGTMETVINSVNPPGVNTVFYGNALNPNYTGGTARQFDHRGFPQVQNPALDWYRFAIQYTTSGTTRTAAVRFNTVRLPNTYVLPQLPHGRHKIKWIFDDGCGNEQVCEYPFEIRDCKKPTIVCKPLSVNIMQTGMVTLWASDFLEYAFDNCTPADQLDIAISKGEPAPSAFPRDPNTGLPITSVSFDCTELGPNVIQIWAEDSEKNADFCQVILLVQDNMGNCGQKASVAGYLKTEGTAGVESGNVQLTAPAHPAFPPAGMYYMSDKTGRYLFSNALPVSSNAQVMPVRDDNALNGVTTLDLALISKHILNLAPLTTPYKLIAADANKSGTITTLDIVALRRLILGIDEELTNNTSWRFVDKGYTFPNPQNPFTQPFPEMKTLANIQAGTAMSEDFVGVKVGDVNGTAQANSLMTADDRTAGTLFIDANDAAVQAGEAVTVSFKAATAAEAYQLTMNLEGLEVLEIIPGAKMGMDNFAVFNNAITMAVENGAGAFSIKFRALKSGQLSSLMTVSSRITKAVAYTATGDANSVAIRFNSATGSVVAGAGFELLQNTPNPVKDATTIAFNLPEAAEATLTVTNVEGRVLKTLTGQYAKGLNTVTLNHSDLEAGVLFYEVRTATDRATRKMVVVEIR